MNDLESKRQALARLDARLAEGEIGAEEYERLRALLTSGLSPEQCAWLRVTPSPRPVTEAGARIGPSGGRTRMPTLAELEIEPGTVLLDQWRIVRELGRGGFGAVFEAEDVKLGRTLAVKVLDPAMAAKEGLLARFRREVTLTRELAHERIVRVYDYREDASEHLALITMEYVRGCSVQEVLALARGSKKPVPVALALAIFEQTLEALAAAHAKGVIHRDVTPGNILLAGGVATELMSDPERDPQVKLVDFGIAGLVERTELSAKSRVLGTAAYVAPEVLDPDAEITPEVDVFGAGAVVYELLTGKTPMVTGYRQVTDLREEVMPGVGGTITSTVQPMPKDRPSSKGALEALAGRNAEMDRAKAHDIKLEGLREHLSRALVKGDETSVQGAAAALRRALGENWKGDPELQRSDAWLQETKKKREEAARQIKAAEEKRRREREAAERRQRGEERKKKEQQAAEKAKREKEVARRVAEARAAADEKRRLAEEERRRSEATPGPTVGSQAPTVQSVGGGSGPGSVTRPLRGPAVTPMAAGVALVALVIVLEGIWLKSSRGWVLSPPPSPVLTVKAPTATPVQPTREASSTQVPTVRAPTETPVPPTRGASSTPVPTVRAPTAVLVAPTRAATSAPTQTAPPSAMQGAGAIWTDSGVGMRFRYIPAGSFEMGSPAGEAERDSGERQHRVTLTRGYWMGETEVTQGQWRAVMGTNPSHFSACGESCPVEKVSWLEAVEFANRLSRKAGFSECYRISRSGSVSFDGLDCQGYRLPTEAEWEHAARAGGSATYAGGEDLSAVGCFSGNSGNRTHRVGEKRANGWGLQDLSGNVWEWVWDFYGDYPSGAVTDPTGPSWGSYRVLRGGSWHHSARNCRSAKRGRYLPGHRYDYLGLRLVRTAE